MAQPLMNYGTRWKKAPNAPLVDVPVLVWEPAESTTSKPLDLTTVGLRFTRPGQGFSLVFELRKGTPQEANPFTMGITVGRAETNDISIDDASVSRFHAYFREQGPGQWFLVDAESKNGTWAGPLKLSANQPVAVMDGMQVRVGDVRMKFMLPATFQRHVSTSLEISPENQS